MTHEENTRSRKPEDEEFRSIFFDKVSAILSGSDSIADSNLRLEIQASCLDLMASVNDYFVGSSAGKQKLDG